MITTVAVSNYRSLRQIVVPLARLNVVTGPNGSGKSNLYRALRLLAAVGQGEIVSQLAREGGLGSTLWAGPETISRDMRSGRHPVQGTSRTDSVRLLLGFAADDWSYAVDLGLPPPDAPPGFLLDPAIKRECIWSGPVFRRASLVVDRRGPALLVSDESGAQQVRTGQHSTFESMLTEHVDMRDAPEMVLVRSRLRSWRFYDHFRSDLDAPARRPQVGTYTPILGSDGADVAAALQTIRAVGDRVALDDSIDDAFPGSRLDIASDAARFELLLRQPGMLRSLTAADLSDGTLRYLLLAAALLSPRSPDLLVLNEPETSLHPDLVPALARLIVRAAAKTQVMVVTHSSVLLAHLEDEEPDLNRIRLDKELGETVTDQDPLERPPWSWPPR